MDVAERLFGFQLELELELCLHDVSDLTTRDQASISRGYLELARNYGEPLDVAAAEKAIVLAAERIGDSKWLHPFLVRLRTVSGWARSGSSFAA